MKKVTQLNHYEILDLEPSATKAEIQRSYYRLKRTYQTDSLAIYSIVSGAEREYMEARIDEAYKVLVDDIRRREYDESIGINHFDMEQKADEKGPMLEMVKIIEQQNQDAQQSYKEEEVEKQEESLNPLSQDFLKSFRERKGVSLREISESTNISLSMLSYLEEGKYNRLPGRTYAVGFLREYARYLGMDYQQAIQNLEKWAPW